MAKAKTYKAWTRRDWILKSKTRDGFLAAYNTKDEFRDAPVTITEGHTPTGTTSPHIASLAARILKGGKYTKAQVLELAGSCVTQADGSGGSGHRIKKAKPAKVRYYAHNTLCDQFWKIDGANVTFFWIGEPAGVESCRAADGFGIKGDDTYLITPRQAAAIRAKWKPRVKVGKRGKR